MEEKRTEINKLGEFGLINSIAEKFDITQKSSILGIGDDAAVIAPENSRQMVVTTDMLLEGVHFLNSSWF